MVYTVPETLKGTVYTLTMESVYPRRREGERTEQVFCILIFALLHFRSGLYGLASRGGLDLYDRRCIPAAFCGLRTTWILHGVGGFYTGDGSTEQASMHGKIFVAMAMIPS